MIFPLNLEDMSLFLAITAFILLIASEFLSQQQYKSNIFIKKKKLRNAAITFSILFLITISMRIMLIIAAFSF